MQYLAQKEHFWVCPITEHIVRIIGAGQENMTLIEGEDKALLFDTGSGFGNIRQLCEQMTRKPIIVVASHGHPDHVGGVGYFEEAYVHVKDLEMAGTVYSAKERALCEDMLSKQTRNAHLSIDLRKMAPDSGKVTWHTISEGDQFDLGRLCLEVVEMPGHGGAIPDPFSVFEGNLDAVEGILSGRYEGYPDPRHTRLGKNVYRAKPEIERESFSVGLEGFCRDGMLGNVLISRDRVIK